MHYDKFAQDLRIKFFKKNVSPVKIISQILKTLIYEFSAEEAFENMKNGLKQLFIRN